MARRLFQHRLLRADIAEALRYTEKHWGKRKKDEYKALIKDAKDARNPDGTPPTSFFSQSPPTGT